MTDVVEETREQLAELDLNREQVLKNAEAIDKEIRDGVSWENSEKK